jgi:thiol-disulfide isomerase/thioredoxin
MPPSMPPQQFHRFAYSTSPANALALLLALALCGCDNGPEQSARPTGNSDASTGPWLIVNYWAEWCAPCLEEIPELNAFARKHAGRARVQMVNFDGLQGAPLRELAAKLGIETEVLEEDPAARLGLATPQVLPSTFVIPPDGGPATVLVGAQTVADLERASGL